MRVSFSLAGFASAGFSNPVGAAIVAPVGFVALAIEAIVDAVALVIEAPVDAVALPVEVVRQSLLAGVIGTV